MPTIVPISDLRDYNKVVALVEPGSPVYLTRNGRDEYVIMPAAEYKRGAARAEIFRLLRESEDSVARGERTWTIDEVRKDVLGK